MEEWQTPPPIPRAQVEANASVRMCVKLILAKDNVEDSVQRGVKALLQCFEFVKYISRKVEKHRIRPAHTLVYLYGRRHVCVCVFIYGEEL